MRTSENIADLAAALSKAQAKIEGAVKGSENPHFRNRYADLGAVWEAIREPLTANGLSITQWLRTVDGGVEVETLLLHSTGQYMSDVFAVPVGKQDAQGYGSAATYARRYSLMAAVGIAPVDDDGNGATQGAGNGPSFTPTNKPSVARENGAPKAASPPSAQNGNGSRPGAIPAATNYEAAETFTTQSIDAIGKLRHKEALHAWWRDNKKHIDRLEAKHRKLYDRLLAAYDEQSERLPHVTAAA